MKKVGEGSAKNLFLDPSRPSHVFFEFSDRVSVFDYGALEEEIPGKGKNLTRFAKKIFGVLNEAQLPTAFAPALNSEKIAMRAATHPKFPELRGELKFIPLEVIFRFGVPPGSSLLKRRPELKAFARFSEPLIEFSTKLETQDRLLDRSEAQLLAGSAETLVRLEKYTTQLADELKKYFTVCGLELWDGKIECALTSAGEIVMVDAITPDELRLSFPGLENLPLSKDLLRLWLGSTTWAFDIAQLKKSRGLNWKEASLPRPPRLGSWRLEKLSGLYEVLADTVEQKNSKALLEWIRADAHSPKVYLVGNGGREAALRDRLTREGVEMVGNPEGADCIWVSPDAELAAGMVDDLEKKGFWTFGPRAAAAKIEWSKDFGREIAQSAGLRIPQYSTELGNLRKFSEAPVVKKDGLAAGKGVVVTESFEEAEKIAQEFSLTGKVLLEERLRGFEASAFFAAENGYYGPKVFYLGTAKDFKRRLPGDEGPNTGGMGAYAPHPDVTESEIHLFEDWALKTVEALGRRGEAFHGIIYLGLMKDEKKGWALIEYNARLGDPETQALTVLWDENEEKLRPLLALSLKAPKRMTKVQDDEGAVMCLALVNPDYPDSAAKKVELVPWEPPSPLKLFRTASLTGRVAYLVVKADSLVKAGDQIFEALVASPWKDSLDWRPDILR